MAAPPECSSGKIPESEMELPPRIGIAAAIEPVETIGIIEAHGAETRQVDLNTNPRPALQVGERDVAELIPDVAGVVENRRVDGVRDLYEVLGRHQQERIPAVVGRPSSSLKILPAVCTPTRFSGYPRSPFEGYCTPPRMDCSVSGTKPGALIPPVLSERFSTVRSFSVGANHALSNSYFWNPTLPPRIPPAMSVSTLCLAPWIGCKRGRRVSRTRLSETLDSVRGYSPRNRASSPSVASRSMRCQVYP